MQYVYHNYNFACAANSRFIRCDLDEMTVKQMQRADLSLKIRVRNFFVKNFLQNSIKQSEQIRGTDCA